MRLILFRHGPAVEREAWQGPDHLRPLTDEGRKRTRQVVKAAKRLLKTDRLLTSPWVRARETTAILADVLGLDPDEVDWLAGGIASADERIRELPHQDAILVGHEPDLGELAGLLKGGRPVPLKKAGFAILEGDPVPQGMTLVTLLSPKVLLTLVE